MLNPYKEEIGNEFPLSKIRVTSPYGMRTLNGSTSMHKGIDLVSDGDKTLVAVDDGTITVSKWHDSWGNYVLLQLRDGTRVYYCHMKESFVNAGERVRKGDSVGTEGSTGETTGSHLHLEIRPPGASTDALDAAAFLDCKNEIGKFVKATPVGDMKDDQPSDWAVSYWNWAKDFGLTDGTRPRDFVKREELAAILQRFYDKLR